MTSSLVSYDVQPPAVVISLSRSEKRNALSRALITGLTEAFMRASDDREARAVILTGRALPFVQGWISASWPKPSTLPRSPGLSGKTHCGWPSCFDLIYTLPKPTIAAVNGTAAAGGAGLVTVCDLAIAVPDARFGYPEVRRGLVAAMVMPHLLRHTGERVARYLFLTGEFIDAHEACRTGLINEVVPAAKLFERARELAGFLAEGGPQALATTKELLRRFSSQAMSVEETARASAEPRLGQECQQGLRAFFAKQPPPWAPTGQ